MFQSGIEATIRSAAFKCKESDGKIKRTGVVTLEMTFDQGVARGISDDALAVYDGLKSSGLEQVKIPIGAMAMKVVINDGEHEVETARGVSAVACAPKGGDELEESLPFVRLSFEFILSSEDASFFALSIGREVKVEFQKRQLSLAA